MRVLSLLFLFLVGCNQAEVRRPLSNDELFKLGSLSVVRILSLDGHPHGSGFITTLPSGDKVVITNEHVCYSASKNPEWLVTLDIFGDSGLPLKASKMDGDHDLCAIKLPKALQDKVIPLKLASRQINRTKTYVVGYPGQHKLSFGEGYSLGESEALVLSPGRDPATCKEKAKIFFGLITVCVKRYQLIETSVIIHGGNSGSMALNEYGEVVGVFNSADTDDNMGSMIKLQDLKDFLGSVE